MAIHALMCVAGWLCSSDGIALEKEIGFADFPAEIEKLSPRLPSRAHLGSDDAARDQFGKLVQPPAINFAGHYFFAAHSCGTYCRFHTLTDLRNGSEIHVPGFFNSVEPTPRTADGFRYIVEIRTRPDSRLVLADFELQNDDAEPAGCRREAFVFEGDRFRSVAKRTLTCRLPGLFWTCSWTRDAKGDDVNVKWGIFMVAGAIALALSGGLVASLYAVGDDCVNTEFSRIDSPDGKLSAVVFHRNCGATTDFNTQVSIVPSGSILSSEVGNAFSADTDHGRAPADVAGGPVLEVSWRSPGELVVSHHPAARTFQVEPRNDPIHVIEERERIVSQR